MRSGASAGRRRRAPVRAAAPSRSRGRARCAAARSAGASAASARRRSRSLGARLERPGQRGQRPAPRPALDLVRREEPARLVPERARLARRRRRRSRPRGRGRAAASGACRPCRRGSGRARPGRCAASRPARDERSSSAFCSSSRNGEPCDAARQAALLQAEHEDDLEPTGARPQEVEHRHAAGLARAREPDRRVVEQRRRPPLGVTSPPRSRQPSSSATSLERPLVRPQVEPRGLVRSAATRDRGRSGSSRARAADRRERVGGGPDCVEVRQRLAAQLRRSPPRPGRLTVTPRPRSRPSRKSTWCAREPRVRRAQEGEQVAPLAVEPGVAQQREQRLAERRLAEPQPALERVGHAERREGGVERAPASGRATGRRSRSRRGIRAGAQQREHLVRDELERAAQAGALEEADRAVELRRRRRASREERALEVGERRRARARGSAAAPRSARRRGAFRSSDVRVSDAKASRPGSYGSETVTSARAGERLEQRPLGAGQVLEAVGEDRARLPGAEVAGGALGGVAPLELTVPEPEPVELRAVGAVERGRARRRARRARAARTRARPRSSRARRRSREKRADGPRPLVAPATTRRSSSARCASADHRPVRAVAPRRSARRGRRRCRSSRPRARRRGASSSRSARSTSGRFGTIRIGSDVERAQVALEQERDLPRVRRALRAGSAAPGPS